MYVLVATAEKKSPPINQAGSFGVSLGVMDPKRKSELDWLLARGRLSGPALERVLERAVSTQRPTQRLKWHLFWFAPAVAAGLAIFLVRPWQLDGGFRSKGSAGTGAAVRVELVCGDQAGNDVRCARSDSLYFSTAGGTADARFVSAYAEPEGTGERVWFFPTSSDPSIALESGPERHVLKRGIRLEGVPAGRYRVRIAISDRPLERTEVLGAPAETATLEVLP
jgi:hypothetical protein